MAYHRCMIDELVAHTIPSYNRITTEARIKANRYRTMQLVATPISMIMAVRRSNSSFAVIAFYLCVVPLTGAETNSSCPGPTAYYKALGCTPISTDTSSTCPERYDCNFLKSVPADKCFVNGRLYNIGEKLKEEDANPCDIGCVCASGVASFNCAVVDCFFGPVTPGCYRKRSSLGCCPGDEVRPEKPEDRATSVVDGKTYKDGEYFKAPGEPDKSRVCQPGYKENNDDVVIASTDNSSKTTDSNMVCTFGNMTIHVGDELNQATDYNSVCVKCVCEVPPVLTCQRLPDNECDVTKHLLFSTF